MKVLTAGGLELDGFTGVGVTAGGVVVDTFGVALHSLQVEDEIGLGTTGVVEVDQTDQLLWGVVIGAGVVGTVVVLDQTDHDCGAGVVVVGLGATEVVVQTTHEEVVGAGGGGGGGGTVVVVQTAHEEVVGAGGGGGTVVVVVQTDQV